MGFDERENLKKLRLEQKDRTELQLQGGYTRIYPPTKNFAKFKGTGSVLPENDIRDLTEKYDFLISCSKEVWSEITTGASLHTRRRIEELYYYYKNPDQQPEQAWTPHQPQIPSVGFQVINQEC